MKTYLLIDEQSERYYYARRTEDELKAELIVGMVVGEIRPMDAGGRYFITRES